MKDFGLLGVAIVMAGAGLYLSSAGGEEAGYAILLFLGAALAFCSQILLVHTRRGVTVTALFAAACNAYLLKMKLAPSEHAICDVGATISCSAVNASAASELFGLPVTLFGLAFYLGLAAASLGKPSRTPYFDQVNGLFALVSLGFSAYLAWEAKKLGLVCPFCIAIYACNVLLLLGALKGLHEQGKTLFAGLDRVFGAPSLWTITTVFAFVTLIGASSWNSRDKGAAREALDQVASQRSIDPDTLRELYGKPEGRVTLDGTEPALGRLDAPITIVEFADYGCPHCAMASPVLKKIVENDPEVRLLFKAFPLSGACNPIIPGEEGAERCKAAMAAECAGDQGRYFELSAMLFKNLGYRTDDDLRFMANEVGLDMEAWERCMQSPLTMEAVLADAKAGIEAMVRGTPTLFVKGLVGDDWVEITAGPEALEALLQARRNGVTLPPP